MGSSCYDYSNAVKRLSNSVMLIYSYSRIDKKARIRQLASVVAGKFIVNKKGRTFIRHKFYYISNFLLDTQTNQTFPSLYKPGLRIYNWDCGKGGSVDDLPSILNSAVEATTLNLNNLSTSAR